MALARLLEREALSQHSRYERFMAQMVYVLAGGKKIDMDVVQGFSGQIEEIYENPFKKKPQPMTAEEIKNHVLRLLEGGS